VPIELVAMFVSIRLYGSAYIAEDVCSGLNQVPRGLTEAEQVLGSSRRVIWGRIKVPMARDPCQYRICRH
jgi:ABC-type amino acid transport system permease subunit